MKLRIEDRNKIRQFLTSNLDLSSKARFHFEIKVSTDIPIMTDLIIENNEKRYFVTISRKTTWDDLAHLALIRELEGKSNEYLLSGRLIPDSIKRTAERIDIKPIMLPEDIFIIKETMKPRGKITSDKAWKIILNLIKNQPCSIRSISLSEGISYGWTHNVISNLVVRGSINKHGNHVGISNIDDIWNAVAWERPLKDLIESEIVTSFDSIHDLARTLTDWSERKNIDLAITSYMSATLYFGYGIRSDILHCYVSGEKARKNLVEEFDSGLEKGIKIIMLKPDRDLMKESVKKDSIRITSLEQTLLDLGSMGFPARDLLDEVVKVYGADSK